MAYLLYALTFLTLVSGTLLYVTRAHWLPSFTYQIQDLGSRLRYTFTREYIYSRLPATFTSSSFADDMEAGLSSSTFDLGANVEGGDSRAGLDDAAKRAILRIMKKRRLNFDAARRVYMEQRFADNGIGADGRPRDPKFVSFS
ncbi:protein precursor [Coniochaeta ligniaria NRRL 30616]|uniref:Protein n=1 Tax=Coniochaeta ligniaria NRRL 30616 TaxID=1408157 RepID=A0A1J7J3C1_9PEZI|nr:protein precursor [Coniochaeta ligniaria NRRL 30616]